MEGGEPLQELVVPVMTRTASSLLDELLSMVKRDHDRGEILKKLSRYPELTLAKP